MKYEISTFINSCVRGRRGSWRGTRVVSSTPSRGCAILNTFISLPCTLCNETKRGVLPLNMQCLENNSTKSGAILAVPSQHTGTVSDCRYNVCTLIDSSLKKTGKRGRKKRKEVKAWRWLPPLKTQCLENCAVCRERNISTLGSYCLPGYSV